MEKVLGILWEYRFIVMSLLSLVLYAVMDWKTFKSDAYNYMLRAKTLAKDGILKSGKEQEDWVVNMILEKAPKSWVSFLSTEQKRMIIKKLYDSGLDLLDDGKLNGSI
jgi:hypothetical protein